MKDISVQYTEGLAQLKERGKEAIATLISESKATVEQKLTAIKEALTVTKHNGRLDNVPMAEARQTVNAGLVKAWQLLGLTESEAKLAASDVTNPNLVDLKENSDE